MTERPICFTEEEIAQMVQQAEQDIRLGKAELFSIKPVCNNCQDDSSHEEDSSRTEEP